VSFAVQQMKAIGSNPFRTKALGPYGLSLSELDAIQTLADWGFNQKLTAEILNIGLLTLKSHLTHVREKMGTMCIPEAYAQGVREGFWK
jgi:DNA-binding CsgD family transcriptional regulator